MAAFFIRRPTVAIVIAILIVLNAQDKKDRQPPAPTVTNTITETTPFQSPTAMPNWTNEGILGHGGVDTDVFALPANVLATPWATEPDGRRPTVSEQTWK